MLSKINVVSNFLGPFGFHVYLKDTLKQKIGRDYNVFNQT